MVVDVFYIITKLYFRFYLIEKIIFKVVLLAVGINKDDHYFSYFQYTIHYQNGSGCFST